MNYKPYFTFLYISIYIYLLSSLDVVICSYYTLTIQRVFNKESCSYITSYLNTMNTTNITSSSPTFITVDLSNYYNIQYYDNIYLGSPKQKLSVIFNTDSNVLRVPSP